MMNTETLEKYCNKILIPILKSNVEKFTVTDYGDYIDIKDSLNSTWFWLSESDINKDEYVVYSLENTGGIGWEPPDTKDVELGVAKTELDVVRVILHNNLDLHIDSILESMEIFEDWEDSNNV